MPATGESGRQILTRRTISFGDLHSGAEVELSANSGHVGQAAMSFNALTYHPPGDFGPVGRGSGVEAPVGEVPNGALGDAHFDLCRTLFQHDELLYPPHYFRFLRAA